MPRHRRAVEYGPHPYDTGFASHWGGRHSGDRRNYRGKLTIERIRLDRQGYTRGGKYFGTGAPLFDVYDEDYDVFFQIRARDRDAAKRLVRSGYPNAQIGR